MAARPISPACLEPGFPIQTTLQRRGVGVSSSRISSTIWPRLISKVPRRRKPSLEESSTRQGSLFGLRSKLTIRLAGRLDIKRFDRRALETGKLGIFLTSSVPLKCSDGTRELVSCEMGKVDQVSMEASRPVRTRLQKHGAEDPPLQDAKSYTSPIGRLAFPRDFQRIWRRMPRVSSASEAERCRRWTRRRIFSSVGAAERRLGVVAGEDFR